MPNNTNPSLPPFCGERVTPAQLELIETLVERCRNLSRTELAATVCELLGWVRKNGKPKTVEGLAYLEHLAQRQRITLPESRKRRAKRSAVLIPTDDGAARSTIRADLSQLPPIALSRVITTEQRHRWRALVEQHHYLGHKVPFGAHLRYFIQVDETVLGCLQFSSPAWRLRCRDQWIGWSETQRKLRLQHIVCNSRFLILPWVQVPNLASRSLAVAARTLAGDWFEQYAVTPWLLESLVDPRRYAGTSYRAANWILAGETSGRGRDDRAHRRHGQAPKQVWLYPLHRRVRERLCAGAP